MKSRNSILLDLIRAASPVSKLSADLSRLPWDSAPLVTLTIDHLNSVLQRFVDGSLSAQEVEEWANAVEGRDDIEFEKQNLAALKAAIHALANPALCGRLTAELARELLSK